MRKVMAKGRFNRWKYGIQFQTDVFSKRERSQKCDGINKKSTNQRVKSACYRNQS